MAVDELGAHFQATLYLVEMLDWLRASPGVARQYTGTAGKITNCQIAVSVAW